MVGCTFDVYVNERLSSNEQENGGRIDHQNTRKTVATSKIKQTVHLNMFNGFTFTTYNTCVSLLQTER